MMVKVFSEMSLHIYIYIYIYMYVCVCVCVRLHDVTFQQASMSPPIAPVLYY